VVPGKRKLASVACRAVFDSRHVQSYGKTEYDTSTLSVRKGIKDLFKFQCIYTLECDTLNLDTSRHSLVIHSNLDKFLIFFYGWKEYNIFMERGSTPSILSNLSKICLNLNGSKYLNTFKF
jgi:hypothetical protein